ncbi:MAG: dockerin type I domain-containing protein, partial [Aeoliella sp.]
TLNSGSAPSEAGMLFLEDGAAHALLRRSGSALFGTSQGDFTNWTWQDTGVSVGGPELFQLPDGRLVGAGRRASPTRTSLMWVDPATGALDEFLTLPSGGDTSYPGMLWHDDRLWVSYYSSHEGKTSIYVAQVDFIDEADPPPMLHQGAIDPQSEYWIAQNGGGGVAENGPIDDGGIAAWRISDQATGGGTREAWTRSLTGSQLDLVEQEGWRMKARLRVTETNDLPDGAVELSVFLNSDIGYVVWLGSDANGNAIASEFAGGLGRSATLGGSGYHYYELVHDPGTDSVDLWADGAVLLEDLATHDLHGNVLNRVLWGANASAATGAANYSFVEFNVGPHLAGDYNGDGIVNAADYSVWRDALGSMTDLAADGSRNGVIDAADYEVWRSHFGDQSPSEANLTASQVPEPGQLGLLACAVLLGGVLYFRPRFLSRPA